MIIFSILSLLQIEATEPLPDPYSGVTVLPFDGHGWYGGNKAQIEKLFQQYEIQVVIEVGCWLGESTRHIASLLPSGGKVYAVDHWLGSAEHQLGKSAYHPALPYLYEQFLSNVIHANLTKVIIPIKMDSLTAAKELQARGIIADLVFIDAGHEEEEVYADLNAWFPFVRSHGILCGDDWTYPSIRKMVTLFASENGLLIDAADGRFWRLYN